METEQKFYVYVDYREDDGKPFYVGKGMEGRVKDLERNPLHTRIKNKHGIIREVVFETHSEQESFEKEIQLIGELQTYVHHGNGGANLTLGGEGGSGYKFTEEQREKMSESMKKAWEDPVRKEKGSEIGKKMWASHDFKEKMKKVWEDPEHKAKVYESRKKMWEDPEHKGRMRESHKIKWQDEEYREKQLEAKNSEKCKKKTSESVKKLWEDPEHKGRMRESLRKGWEKRRLKFNKKNL